MLQVSGLSKHYSSQELFNDAGFVIGQGERVGLVGRNGHGKSTLFRIILGQESADEGQVICPKHYSIGHLSQHIHFTEKTVLAEACLGLPDNDEGWQATHVAEAVLSGLGFSEEMQFLAPDALSGGYQVRLNLAKLLVSEVNLLLLDEPTNYLDIVSLRWLRQFLCSWKGELVIITHDRQFMDSVTTHTMGIHRSKVRKVEGQTKKYYSLLAEEEEIYEKTLINQQKQRAQTEAFIERFRAKASKARQVQSRVKALDREGQLEALEEIRDLEFSFNYKDFPGKRPLVVKDLSFSYTKTTAPLFKELNLEVGANDRIGIIGKNGMGKTTLLNLLAGELEATSGSIALNQHAEPGFFGQTNVERLEPAKTIEQEVLSVEPDSNRTKARGLCGAMMFEGDLALKKIEVLSGGEKSRVLLAKVLAKPSNVLLLDEPTNHLDMYACESFIEAVKAFPGAVIFVTHDEGMLYEVAERLVVFDQNGVDVFEGGYEDFLNRVGWQEEGGVSKKKPVETELSKKERRQQRAEQLKAKQDILKPLEKKSKKLEKDIASLEESLEKQQQELLDGTKDGYSDAMAKLSRSIHQQQTDRDSLYEELEKVLLEIEQKEKKLESEL